MFIVAATPLLCANLPIPLPSNRRSTCRFFRSGPPGASLFGSHCIVPFFFPFDCEKLAFQVIRTKFSLNQGWHMKGRKPSSRKPVEPCTCGKPAQQKKVCLVCESPLCSSCESKDHCMECANRGKCNPLHRNSQYHLLFPFASRKKEAKSALEDGSSALSGVDQEPTQPVLSLQGTKNTQLALQRHIAHLFFSSSFFLPFFCKPSRPFAKAIAKRRGEICPLKTVSRSWKSGKKQIQTR